MADDPGQAGPVRKGLVPPHTQLFDILRQDEHAELLAWAIGSEPKFEPAKVYLHSGEDGAQVDPKQRVAMKFRGLGPMAELMRGRLMERLPEIADGTGYRGPSPTSIEFELNAYGEGGHFGRHIDVSTGKDRRPLGGRTGADRILSAVYYFYSEPKAFSGGALRLYRLVADKSETDDSFVAYEPLQNSLVAFPSWAPHSVERVSCPSGRFADYRFGLNCWFCRTLGA